MKLRTKGLLAVASLAIAALWALLGVMHVLAQPATPATAGSLIGLVYDPVTRTEYVAHIDPVTGAAAPIGPGYALCCDVVGLDAALDSAGGRLLAVLSTLGDATPRLYAFDIATGVASASEPLTTSAGVNFLVVDPATSEVLALVFESAANRMRLVQVDPASGAFSPRGAGLANCCSVTTLDAALDAANDRLFAAMRPLDSITPTLYTIDIGTGSLLTATELAPFVSVNYMVFDDDAGVLRALVYDEQSGAERLATIDPATGAINMTGEGAAGCCNLLPTDATLDTGNGWLTLPLIGQGNAPFLFSFGLNTGAVVHQPPLSNQAIHYVKFYTSPPPPVLVLQKAAPEAVAPGAVIEYNLTVDNQGGSAAADGVVRDVLPTGAVLLSASAGAVLEPTTHTQGATLHWSLGALAVNAQRGMSFTVRGPAALVNTDYRVTASGGVQAVGRRPVVTLVGEEISAVDAVIGVTATTAITAAGGDLSVVVPPGAVTSTTSARVVASSRPAGNSGFSDLTFNIVLTDAGGSPLLKLVQPLTITIGYDDESWQTAGVAQESDLTLTQWQAGAWIPLLPCAGCLQDTVGNRFVVVVNQPGLYALSGDFRVHLPSVSRDR